MYINDKLYVNITYIKERKRTQSLARNISSYVLKHNHCWIIILIYLFPVFLMKIIIKVRYLFVILSFERHIIVKIQVGGRPSQEVYYYQNIYRNDILFPDRIRQSFDTSFAILVTFGPHGQA